MVSGRACKEKCVVEVLLCGFHLVEPVLESMFREQVSYDSRALSGLREKETFFYVCLSRKLVVSQTAFSNPSLTHATMRSP